jgi:arsenical pump membrane protein
VQTVTAIGLLAIVLAFAVARPARLPEAAMAVPAAVVAVLIGLVSWSDAWSELSAVGPTVGFLAAGCIRFPPRKTSHRDNLSSLPR